VSAQRLCGVRRRSGVVTLVEELGDQSSAVGRERGQDIRGGDLSPYPEASGDRFLSSHIQRVLVC